MTIAIVVFPNQNDISKSEVEKIRRAVKADFPGSKTRVYANEEAQAFAEGGNYFPDVKEDQVLVYETSDVNYSVSATLDHNRSTLSPKRAWEIEL